MSSRSAKEITQSLKDVADKIAKGVNLANQAGTAFQEVSMDIDNSSDLLSSISQSMQEQEKGTEDILRSIEMVLN